MNNLSVKIIRFGKSYDFRINPKLDSFDNNRKNNSLDLLVLLAGGEEIFRARCQSVANYCFGEMATADTRADGDTVAPGNFRLKCFVPPRAFHGEIHGITETRDLDGQWINREAMQTTAGGFQNGRWLVHDRYSFKTGRDTNYAWSAGCFILSSGELLAFNTYLHAYGVVGGDIIAGEVTEV
jgi:hypothetical protein